MKIFDVMNCELRSMNLFVLASTPNTMTNSSLRQEWNILNIDGNIEIYKWYYGIKSIASTF
jgi:hypothetical protein